MAARGSALVLLLVAGCTAAATRPSILPPKSSLPAPKSSGSMAQNAQAACDVVASADCSKGVPSYRTDIAPIVRERCLACHDGDGEAGPENDFRTRDGLYSHRRGVAARIQYCAMPPRGAPQPSAAARDLLVKWAACGAPDG